MKWIGTIPGTRLLKWRSIARFHSCRLREVKVAGSGTRKAIDTLDGNASIWTNTHGHNQPDINKALVEQLGKIAHSTFLGLSHPVGAMLGKRLADLAPESLSRVGFSDNGSNAVEIALKLPFQFWQLVGKPEKRLVVGMENGYHGDTFGAMAARNSFSVHGRFQPWLFE